MRKPRPFVRYGGELAKVIHYRDPEIGFGAGLQLRPEIVPMFMDRQQAERLAAWLLKAAAWIREQEGK